MDSFVLDYSQDLKPKDFVSKDERVSRNRKGKRQYLKDSMTHRMMKELYDFLLMRIEVPAMRHGKSQAIETLISEEAQLLAKHLRDERKDWIPRIARAIFFNLSPKDIY